MFSEKRYEILKYLPPYGPMHVSISDSGMPFYSEGFVVRFYKDDGSDWVANFKTGWGNLNTVVELPYSSNLLVIAHGICYVMNPNETTPIDSFGVGFNELMFIPNRGLVLHDDNCLEVLYKDGTIAHIGNYFWDGIKDVVIDGNIIKGISCDYTDVWTPFEYNMDTKELKIIGGNWYYHPDDGSDLISEPYSLPSIKKPWWKLW